MRWPDAFSLASKSLIACAFSLLSYSAQAQSVGDFALLDHTGKFHQLSYYGDQKAFVLYAQANDHPAVSAALPRLVALRDAYAKQDMAFFLLNVTASDTREAVSAAATEAGHGLPVLMDESQLVAQSLGIESLAEILVIDPATRTLLYRGALNEASQPIVNELLQQALTGTAQPITETSAGTHPVRYASRDAFAATPVSYSKDIVPILENNCVSCHHDGGIGPWSMSSHAMIRGWSPMMREVVMNRRMPPGQIDEHLSKPIVDAAGLSTKEKQKLIHWIGRRFPHRRHEDPLTQLTFDNPKFSLGTPDLIYKVPPPIDTGDRHYRLPLRAGGTEPRSRFVGKSHGVRSGRSSGAAPRHRLRLEPGRQDRARAPEPALRTGEKASAASRRDASRIQFRRQQRAA